MFQGQILFSGTSVYSPWMPRGGDYMLASGQLLAKSGSNNLVVTVFTKNQEDTGNGSNADAGVSITLTTAGTIVKGTWGPSVLKEMVRYKFSAEGSTDWFLFRMLDATWTDEAKA